MSMNNANAAVTRHRVVAAPEGMNNAETTIYRRLGRLARMTMQQLRNDHPVVYRTTIEQRTIQPMLQRAERALARQYLQTRLHLLWTYPPKGTGTMQRMRWEGAINEMMEERLPAMIDSLIAREFYPMTANRAAGTPHTTTTN